ncbi:hypothetical protein EVAR_12672_1 [Eumeta japonica]|uniref:Uncharacterized protein n=1 Tax=Eumeta variegata TaxID=151549 RepID=A0A4C1YWG6_EUMVA|nr:hypothetical protein EVAR_12672_1 [Eumeta japonica]
MKSTFAASAVTALVFGENPGKNLFSARPVASNCSCLFGQLFNHPKLDSAESAEASAAPRQGDESTYLFSLIEVFGCVPA